MPRVIHFEIHADDPRRAADFYSKVFDWKISKWEGGDYWLVTTGPDSEPGISGGLMKREGGQHTVNTVGVDSIEEYAKKVTDAGGRVVLQKTPIPGMGYVAYCLDTEGNMFGIFQGDMSAK